MGTGAITGYIDVAQIVLYMFWIFFFGVIYYLVRENHREGYPMETTRGRGTITGWPTPDAKTYLLHDGNEVHKPGPEPEQVYQSSPSHGYAGAPIEPTGNPLTAGVGPGAWAARADVPDPMHDGTAKIAPMRTLPQYAVSGRDTDPRGLPVVGLDGEVGGRVVDVWLDRMEYYVRYLEVETPSATGPRRVLLPIPFCRIRRDEVVVKALLASQLAGVPATKHPEQITLLEEEKISAYYGAGTLYATPERAEPLV